MSESKLRWGIIGAGAIAKAFIHGVRSGSTGVVTAVASRTQDKADKFGDQFDIPNRHGSYDDLLNDREVDAVYIATPHPMHAEWSIKAAEAGKHILCEKPLTLNGHQAHAMIQAARENNVFFMEAFMYRCNPQTRKLVELLKDQTIGQVTMIRATFGFGKVHSPIDTQGRMFSNALGGGGIMDVGCYPVSMSRLIAGAVEGKPFANPVEVSGTAKLVETGVDAWAAATLKFENEIVAQVATAVMQNLDNQVTIFGSEGRIVVPNPWIAGRQDATNGSIEIHQGNDIETITVEADRTSFSYEADIVANAIKAGQVEAPSPAMTWMDSVGNLETLDQWRAAVGVTFEAETPEGQGAMPLRGGTLKARADHNMKYGEVEHLDKKVSKFVFGCDNQRTYAHASVVFDAWFEAGGNAFDTGYIYGGGTQEKLLGQWMKQRGVRDQCVVLTKGAHTPHCYPDKLTAQLMQSLDRIQCDSTDIYIMHRDNLDVPVGEFVDVLNEHLDAGRFQAFGGSNWTLERIAAANDYAKQHGKRGFTVTSNNLSLARMVHPIWDGCIHISDSASRQWMTEHPMTNFAWSSQARGYFLEESERLKLGRDMFEKWDAPDNRARRVRAEELAAKKGVLPINIAAAYVLHQPFPSFALVGPRNVCEIGSTLPGLDVELTTEQVAWLWGED